MGDLEEHERRLIHGLQLVLEGECFLAALAENYIYFGLLQRRRLVKLRRAHVQIVKVTTPSPSTRLT